MPINSIPNHTRSRKKTIEQAIRSLQKFGDEGVERFKKWVAMFE